jgi:hypothetical protein
MKVSLRRALLLLTPPLSLVYQLFPLSPLASLLSLAGGGLAGILRFIVVEGRGKEVFCDCPCHEFIVSSAVELVLEGRLVFGEILVNVDLKCIVH